MNKPEELQNLFDEVDDLRKSLISRNAPNNALAVIQHRFDEVTSALARDAQGKVPATVWAALSDDTRAETYKNLVEVRAALVQAVVSDGPTDQKSIMYRNYASNHWIVALTLLGIAGMVAVLLSIYAYWPSATEKTSNAGLSSGPAEANVFAMVILMGALGGLIHLTSSLGKFVGNRQLLTSWIIYYLLMPFEGASLAAIIYLLLRVGVLAPATSSGSSTANLNLVGLYAFAGLTGLFSKQAIDMLADVFATIFKKVRAKDALSEDNEK